MARTLVGRLQLILETTGLGKAQAVESALARIERAAKSLGNAGWGVRFQSQVDRLALNAKAIGEVQRSWERLHTSMRTRGLSAALQKSEIAAWKTSTLGYLSSVRSEMDAVEKRARSFKSVMRDIARMGGVVAGVGSLGWGAGIATRAGLTAASEERRVAAEAKYAGLSGHERGKIDVKANELSTRFRLQKAAIYEVLKEASLAMPSTDSAITVGEEMARAYLILENTWGPEGAIGGLRQFNKAMDNLEMLTPAEYRYGIDAMLKAQQVLGKDFSPEMFAQMVKYSRAAGKILSPEFMFEWLPVIAAETSGADAGNQIRATFDQLISGRAPKSAKSKARELGLMGKDGKIVGQDDFQQNASKWVNDYLIPAFLKAGVNMDDEIEVGRLVGQLTGNRLSNEFMIKSIISMAQWMRIIQERLPNAHGLKAADDIQADNPFAAFEGFKSALQNLSAAVLPMKQISGGLNTLADTINAFTAKVRAQDPAVLGTAGVLGLGLGVAGVGAWKVSAGIWGLITAGTSLQTAAAMLQAAAISQGGGVGGLTGGKGGKGVGFLGGRFGLAGATATGLVIGIKEAIERFSKDVADQEKLPPAKDYSSELSPEQARDNWQRQFHGVPFEGGMHRVGRGAGPAPGVTEPSAVSVGHGAVYAKINEALDRAANDPANLPIRHDIPGGRPGPLPASHDAPPARDAVAEVKLDAVAATAEARSAGAKIEDALSVTATPKIDLSAAQALVNLTAQALNNLRAMGSAAASARSSTEAQMRRNFADYGVAP